MRIFSPIVEPSGLRAEFPVLRELAYMNAGTDGPVAERAVAAARAELERELDDGRAIVTLPSGHRYVTRRSAPELCAAIEKAGAGA